MKKLILILITLCLTGSLLAEQAPSKTWQPPYDGSDTGVLYLPDANAVYWRYGWIREEQDLLGIKVSGSFPDARYMSYNVYDDDTKSSLGSFTDFKIKPSSGVNPYTGAEGTGTYEIYILPEGSPVEADNVLYFPKEVKNVCIMVRHYVPEGGLQGGVDMPLIESYNAETKTASAAPESSKVKKISKTQVKEYLLPMFKDMVKEIEHDPSSVLEKIHHKDTQESLGIRELLCKRITKMIFDRFKEGEANVSYRISPAGTYPNNDNFYLLLPAIRKEGEVLLVKLKATDAPQSPQEYADSTVRYFSFSQGDELTYNYQTLFDETITVADDGYAYFVLGDESPELKEKAQSWNANFMPWKTDNKMVILYRQMLPHTGFENGINSVPIYDETKEEKGQEGQAYIGDYAPIGKLFSPEEIMNSETFPEIK